MSNSRAQTLGSSTTIFFSVTCYFIFFLSLGFSSFPLQTHLRHTLSPQTASLLAGLIPIAACGTYFLARFAEGRGYLRYPQRALLAAAIGVSVMQGTLGIVLSFVANGKVFISPAVDVGVCLLALGSAQSCMITLLNHNAVASLGSLAYTARAAGSAGYMVAVVFMGATGNRFLDIEAQHLYAGSAISTATCLLTLAGCFLIRPISSEVRIGEQTSAREEKSPGGGWNWFGLVATVYLIAICEMSFGIYSHEFLTTRLGSLGYYQFALGIALEIAILVTIPVFPWVRRSLLIVGPVGWLILFSGCLLSMSFNPVLGWASLALCLNCPFQISANENALRFKPSVVGVATLTLAQSLGYVTAACVSSLLASNLAFLENFMGIRTLKMPMPLWIAVLPLTVAALMISLRVVFGREESSRDAAFNVGDFGHSRGVPGGGTVASSEERFHDFKGNFGANHPGTDAQDVHIVMLHTLAGRVSVVAEAGSDPGELVGGDTNTHSGTAHQDTAIDLPFEEFDSDQLCKIREIA